MVRAAGTHLMIAQETTVTNFSITRATFDDAEGILRCLRAAFEPYRTQYTQAAYEDTVMTTETVRRRIETMTVLVARNEVGLIIGTIGASVRGADRDRSEGWRSSQGGGVANQLLESIEKELRAALNEYQKSLQSA